MTLKKNYAVSQKNNRNRRQEDLTWFGYEYPTSTETQQLFISLKKRVQKKEKRIMVDTTLACSYEDKVPSFI